MNTIETVEFIVKNLEKHGLTLATAESCTGGMLSSAIVDYPGASSVFMGGLVTYSNNAKMKFLNVKSETLEKHGAVSAETAAEMCEGTAKANGTDIGLSTTGVAGPGGGTAEKPVGLVYIGIFFKGRTYTERLMLSGGRTAVREHTVEIILNKLKEFIEKELIEKEN